jgi:hypothetical protein
MAAPAAVAEHNLVYVQDNNNDLGTREITHTQSTRNKHWVVKDTARST